jgi:hypothetical protein
MGDLAEIYKDWNRYKKERRQKLGLPCPDCKIKLPKAEPKILLPRQKCWCGYIDKRERALNE